MPKQRCNGRTSTKTSLETRSRICAVSISEVFVQDGKAYFRDRRPIISRGICCSRSSPTGFKSTALAIWIMRPDRCLISAQQLRGDPRIGDPNLCIRVIDESGAEVHREQVYKGKRSSRASG